MRAILIAIASVATLTFTVGVYFSLHPLLLAPIALVAAGPVTALAAGGADRA